MEKLIIIDESVNFFSKPDVNDKKKKRVEKNEELYIIKIEKGKGGNWINVISENAIEGYINEIDKIAILLPVTLSKQKKVVIYQQPDANSIKIAVVQKNEVFYLLHKTFDAQDQTIIWKKVKLENGKFGYINTDNDLIPVNKSEKREKHTA